MTNKQKLALKNIEIADSRAVFGAQIAWNYEYERILRAERRALVVKIKEENLIDSILTLCMTGK